MSETECHAIAAIEGIPGGEAFIDRLRTENTKLRAVGSAILYAISSVDEPWVIPAELRKQLVDALRTRPLTTDETNG